MISLLDTNLFPVWLQSTIFPTLVFDPLDSDNHFNADLIWAAPDNAVREREEQKNGSAGMLPFVSFYRSGGIQIDEDSSPIKQIRGFKFYDEGPPEIYKEVNATRVRWTYDVVFYSRSSPEIVAIEKALVMKIRKPRQLSFDDPAIELPLGYQFALGTIDDANSYKDEVQWESGILRELGFLIEVDAWAIDGADLTSVIKTINLNIYGYNGDTSEATQDGSTIVIT